MVPQEVSLNNQACRQENDLLQESLQTPQLTSQVRRATHRAA
jgi:hypothetical protein